MNFDLFYRNFEDTKNIYKFYFYMVNLKPTSFGHIEALKFPKNDSNYLFEKKISISETAYRIVGARIVYETDPHSTA